MVEYETEKFIGEVFPTGSYCFDVKTSYFKNEELQSFLVELFKKHDKVHSY